MDFLFAPWNLLTPRTQLVFPSLSPLERLWRGVERIPLFAAAFPPPPSHLIIRLRRPVLFAPRRRPLVPPVHELSSNGDSRRRCLALAEFGEKFPAHGAVAVVVITDCSI